MSRPHEVTDKRGQRLKVAAWTIGLIVVAVIFIILAKVASKPSNSPTGANLSAPASAELIAKVAGVPDSTFESVGQGSANPLPKPIQAPALTQDGKPLIFYAGAEYCPYCAAERWAMVTALLRFGTFTSLGTTQSAAADVFPNTHTFSFHGATYSSPYIAFKGLEMQSNQLQGNQYAALDTPSPSDQQIISTYNAPPYVSKDVAGSIPFIDFGGKFLISGATFSPSVLQGKSRDDIAAALSDPNSDIAKGAVGSANAITAAICSLTQNLPAKVCGTDMMRALQAKVTSQ